jgi:hypothetical protein
MDWEKKEATINIGDLAETTISMSILLPNKTDWLGWAAG